MDRASFLARVRAGVAQGAAETMPPAPEPYRPPTPPDGDELIERLVRELESVDGVVHRVASPSAARRAVLALLRERDARRVVVGQTRRLAALELTDALADAGIEVTVAALDGAATREQLRAAAFEADAGITSVDVGVAETGTLALLARPGQGRAVSLLPPLHVAVLDARDVVHELAALLERAVDAGAPPSALTLITGPSRTGDIELVLTVGVHGPGELHLVLIG